VFETLGRWLRAYAEKDGRGYPDWAVRYAPLVRKLGRLDLSRARVLEIGANENGFARFAHTRAMAVDTEIDHLHAARATQDVLPAQADLSALPFAAGSVDICVCVDTLEHVPPEARAQAAGEIMRVLRDSGVAVVTFPAGEAAARAEQTIQEACRRYTGRSLVWLEEHAARGLPDPDSVIADFRAAAGPTYRITCSKNASLWLWRCMWRVLICGWPGRGNALFQALLRAITPLLCRIHLGACYRTVIWLEPNSF